MEKIVRSIFMSVFACLVMISFSLNVSGMNISRTPLKKRKTARRVFHNFGVVPYEVIAIIICYSFAPEDKEGHDDLFPVEERFVDFGFLCGDDFGGGAEYAFNCHGLKALKGKGVSKIQPRALKYFFKCCHDETEFIKENTPVFDSFDIGCLVKSCYLLRELDEKHSAIDPIKDAIKEYKVRAKDFVENSNRLVIRDFVGFAILVSMSIECGDKDSTKEMISFVKPFFTTNYGYRGCEKKTMMKFFANELENLHDVCPKAFLSIEFFVTDFFFSVKRGLLNDVTKETFGPIAMSYVRLALKESDKESKIYSLFNLSKPTCFCSRVDGVVMREILDLIETSCGEDFRREAEDLSGFGSDKVKKENETWRDGMEKRLSGLFPSYDGPFGTSFVIQPAPPVQEGEDVWKGMVPDGLPYDFFDTL